MDIVLDHKVVDFAGNGTWTFQLIAQWVPLEIVTEIGRVAPPSSQLSDLMVWRPSQSSLFNSNSTFDLVQHHTNCSFLFKRIWHQVLHLKTSFSLLCLLRDHLPLDCTLWKFGSQGPSRCICCSSPNVETLEHVFATGEMPL